MSRLHELATRPVLDRIKALVLDSLNSDHSRTAYDRALTDFLTWVEKERPGSFSKAVVQRYTRELAAQGYSPSTINLRLSAIRKLATEAADNGIMDPVLAQGVSHAKGVKTSGIRTGNWLTKVQAEKLINAPDTSTLKGKRDRALLALLIGCGLRRSEASELMFAHIQQREGRWVIVDMNGKGKRIRTVPMPAWTKVAIDQWAEAAGISVGRVFRPVNKGDRVTGDVLLPQNVMTNVIHYGTAIGLSNLAPHDLRRTFAKLAHGGRAALEQIQLSLGHASIQTTERYLGVRQDLQDAPCDHLGLNLMACQA